MKVLLLVLDGAADRSQESLGMKTPLQAARTPNLDHLASIGSCGLMYPLEPGVCPGSDIAHWHILGYGDHPYPGRAAIEAAGAGIELEDEDVVIRLNLASTALDSGKRYVQNAPAYLPVEDMEEIADSVREYEPVHFETAVHHLGGPFFLIIFKGGASPEITDTDPLYFRFPVKDCEPLEGAGESARLTAEEVNGFIEWSSSVLRDHPVNARRADAGMTTVNFFLSKWASRPVRVPPFMDKWGFSSVLVAGGIFYAGLARCLKMDFGSPSSAEGRGRKGSDLSRASKDLSDKLEIAFESLEEGCDFACVHTKAPDEASHTGKPRMKVRAFEELDGVIIYIAERVSSNRELLVVVTADHATPSGGSEWVVHSGEPVPVVFAGPNVRVDGVRSFDEVSCAYGAIGQIRGRDLMPLILNLTDRARFYGSITGPRKTYYRPRE